MPLYQNIAQDITQRIQSRELSSRLPGVAELAEYYTVNPNTIQRALEVLKTRGVIYGRRGKGTYVTPRIFSGTGENVVIYLKIFMLTNPFYLRFLELLNSRIMACGFGVEVIIDRQMPQTRHCRAALVLENALSGQQLDELAASVNQHRVIVVNRYGSGCITVGSDNFAGGAMAMDLLYGAGHRRIGVIAREMPVNSTFAQRYAGVASVTARHRDLQIASAVVDGNQEGDLINIVNRAVDHVLREMPDATAIFAFTDQLAAQAAAYLKSLGRAIPDDISIIGYDNNDFAKLLQPALTTIEEPVSALADRIMELIGKNVDGDIPVSELLAKPKLIERESVRIIAGNGGPDRMGKNSQPMIRIAAGVE